MDRKVTSTSHPQAHFMNIRSMEIIQEWMPELYHTLLTNASPKDTWKSFEYGYNLQKPFAYIDHFQGAKKNIY